MHGAIKKSQLTVTKRRTIPINWNNDTKHFTNWLKTPFSNPPDMLEVSRRIRRDLQLPYCGSQKFDKPNQPKINIQKNLIFKC